ncbi:MAG: hypothetical protein QXL79_01775 [Sulfolobales archaeon]
MKSRELFDAVDDGYPRGTRGEGATGHPEYSRVDETPEVRGNKGKAMKLTNVRSYRS